MAMVGKLIWMPPWLNLLSVCPGWCGSVDWVPACEPKGHRFDSQSGHMPRLWARPPVVGMQEATTHGHSFLPPFLSLYIYIYFLKKPREKRKNLLSVLFTLFTNSSDQPEAPNMAPYSEVSRSPHGKVITVDPFNHRRASNLSSF